MYRHVVEMRRQKLAGTALDDLIARRRRRGIDQALPDRPWRFRPRASPGSMAARYTTQALADVGDAAASFSRRYAKVAVTTCGRFCVAWVAGIPSRLPVSPSSNSTITAGSSPACCALAQCAVVTQPLLEGPRFHSFSRGVLEARVKSATFGHWVAGHNVGRLSRR